MQAKLLTAKYRSFEFKSPLFHLQKTSLNISKHLCFLYGYSVVVLLIDELLAIDKVFCLQKATLQPNTLKCNRSERLKAER